MNSQFLAGFVDELTKTAAVPMVGKIREGATMLGQKVRAMASSVAKRARGIRAETKGGMGLKGVAAGRPPRIKTAADLLKLAEYSGGDESDDQEGGDEGGANDILKAIISEAEARLNNQDNAQGYNDQTGGGADDPSYGAGQGLPKKKSAKKPLI